jgi:hypothetical protein
MAAFINPLGLAGLTFKAGVKGAGGLLAKFGAERPQSVSVTWQAEWPEVGQRSVWPTKTRFNSIPEEFTPPVKSQDNTVWGNLKRYRTMSVEQFFSGAGMSALHAVAGPAFIEVFGCGPRSRQMKHIFAQGKIKRPARHRNRMK